MPDNVHAFVGRLVEITFLHNRALRGKLVLITDAYVILHDEEADSDKLIPLSSIAFISCLD
jgi:hypothetical protein